MKTYKFLILLLLGCLVFVSCEDAYLDDPAPTSSVNSSIVFSSKAGVEAFISGIHRRARRQFIDTHNGGLYSMYYARDVKANDVLTKATWFLWDYDHTYRAPTYGRTVFSWQFPYYMINQANIGIKGLNEATGIASSEKDELIQEFMDKYTTYNSEFYREYNQFIIDLDIFFEEKKNEIKHSQE